MVYPAAALKIIKKNIILDNDIRYAVEINMLI